MPTFDVVCEVDKHELENAVDQAKREISTRYDFRNSKATIESEELEIKLTAEDDMKLTALQDILRQKAAKRGVSQKLLEFGETEKIGGDLLRTTVTVRNGLKEEEAKKIVKSIKGSKLKVQAQIQAEQVRVSGKKRDDLQTAIQHVKQSFPELELQFINFRD